MCVALEYHACGAVVCFSNIPYAKVRGSTLLPAGAPLHNTITTIGQYGQSQRYWRKACRLECLNHTILLQIIMAIFATLHPDTLTSMNNLAFTLKAPGQDQETLELMEQTVICLKALLPSCYITIAET